MSERSLFIARYKAGESIAALCREFQISRPTAYKFIKRYEQEGSQGLFDRSRKPHRSPHRTTAAVAERVIELRKQRPTWGPKKLKARLETLHPEVRWPAASTIGVLIKDAGLVDGRKRRRRAWPLPLSKRQAAASPNQLWCMDFKGDFLLGNRRRCYPLTVTDQCSRFILGCEALASTKTDPAARSLEMIFEAYGLPDRIRSDNGSPFASTGLCGLTRLSVWLLRLDIELERIEPGHPEQNGRHERMHGTLMEVCSPPASHELAQQERFDDFRQDFNEQRPHEALAMDTPASRYHRSSRRLPGELPPLEYPLHQDSRLVTKSGSIRLGGRDVFLSKALIGQQVGLRRVADFTWLVTFMRLDLAYIDARARTVVPIPSP